ncbi:MAG: phosphate--AMP phosphotransferase, partial [Methanosarcinales archaeon]|nr:phosphate--AMP phosphotransferase [Methanosarcinales archaeon]
LKLIKGYSEELGILQREARELEIPLIIVFEGWYDVCIGEIINRQLLPLDSRGFDFHFTSTPTTEENKMPFIFRFSRKIPPKGKIAVFDRSWYMRGLVERLPGDSKFGCSNLKNKTDLETVLMEPADKEIINTPQFTRLVKAINNFEKTLFDNGTRFIKVYLGARKEKQTKSRKNWEKIIPYYNDKRSTEKMYKKNISVVKEILDQTDTDYAPWNLYFVGKNIDETTAATMKIIIDQMKQIIFDAKSKQLQKIHEAEVKIDKKDKIQNSIVEGPLDSVDFSKSYTKKEYEKKLKKYQKKLSFAHYSLYMNKKPMVLVFEGWDAAGKGGSIKRIVQAMNPRYYRVIPIGTPTDVDHKYHYLWRFLDGIPPCGKTSIYDRSWYGRVMVERVENFSTEEEWSRAYDEINHFEKAMTSDGMIVIKFWMHISKEKQYERFTARSLNPLKQWKLTEEDWRNRKEWDQYYNAVNEMILKTDTKDAPWIIVEANDKYYARIKVLKTIIERVEKELDKEMKEMDLPTGD